MKALFSFAVSFILFSSSAGAQAAWHFNRIHDMHADMESIQSIYVTDSGFVASSLFSDSVGSVGCEFLILDSLGDLISSKTIHLNWKFYYPGWCQSMIRTNDGGYALCGTLADTLSQRMLLIRYDNDGDTMWTRVYSGDSSTVGYQCKQTYDGGFVLVGVSDDVSYWGDAILIKTDSLGNEEWRNYYGGTNFDYGVTVSVANDGGYVIGGETRSFSGSVDQIVFKVDSLGQQEWFEVIGSAFDDADAVVLVSKDSNYLVGGTWTYSQPLGPGLGIPRGRIYLAKLDTSGNIMWSKTYGQSNVNTTVTAMIEKNDGSVVVTGITAISGVTRAFILEVDENGDSLRMRTYSYQSSTMNYPCGIDTTSDGGYVVGGYTNIGTLQSWIFKVDSLLCVVAGCDGVDIQDSSISQSVSVFPNPCNGFVNVVFDSPIEGKGEFILTDMFGRIVFRQVILDANTLESIYFPDLTDGLYFYLILADSQVVKKDKIIVQNW
jgi:Secretion system C-terminal sorting domain